MFRRVLCANIVVIIAVYVDDLLVASETKRDEEQAINDLRSRFSIKDLGEAGLYHLADSSLREFTSSESLKKKTFFKKKFVLYITIILFVVESLRT